jgi:DNA-binding MarR family transcriptional regulator
MVRVKKAVKKATKASKIASQVRWTFLSNHAHVLSLIHSHGDIVLREIAGFVGITERAVQKIIVELEEGGYLVRSRIGRRNHYDVRIDLPLRHPIEAHRTIGDLLKLIQISGK